MTPQLAVYDTALRDKYNIDNVGFIVQVKDIRKKKEPRVVIQEEIFDISEEIYEKTFDEYDKVLHNIKMGIFPSNHPHCNTYFGNCLCSMNGDSGYYSSGGQDLSGLIKVDRRK
jgi:hypothetical protein